MYLLVCPTANHFQRACRYISVHIEGLQRARSLLQASDQQHDFFIEDGHKRGKNAIVESHIDGFAVFLPNVRWIMHGE